MQGYAQEILAGTLILITVGTKTQVTRAKHGAGQENVEGPSDLCDSPGAVQPELCFRGAIARTELARPVCASPTPGS